VIPVTSLLISIDDVLEAFDIKHERSSLRFYSNLAWVTADGVIHLFFTMK
jgi:hypothetical protein